MTERDAGSDSTIGRRLQPVIARLQEIERKCRALGPRNDEAREMAERIGRVIQELLLASDGGAPGPDYAELARRLFPVARLFESLGFMSVAREVAHVDRLLTSLAPDAAREEPAAAASAPSSVRAERPEPLGGPAPATEREPSEPPSVRRTIPPAVATGLAVLLIAVVASIVIVVTSTRRRAPDAAPANVTAMAPVAAEASATPGDMAPTPSTGPVLRPPVGPRSRLADLVGQARLAYQAGNLNEAISLLSQAGSIDPQATSVLETADTLCAELVGRADSAAEAAEWDTAAHLLERARELAVRFNRPMEPIEEATRRHGRLVQYRRLSPDDHAGLQALIGRRIVVLTEGSPVEGTLRGLTDTSLRIELGLEIGRDGALIHTVDVPLRLVREVRYYPQ